MNEAKPGLIVEFQGLKLASNLNGTQGTLLEFIKKEQRWSVRCELDNGIVCAKPDNLILHDKEGTDYNAGSRSNINGHSTNTSDTVKPTNNPPTTNNYLRCGYCGNNDALSECFLCEENFCEECMEDDDICGECRDTMRQHRNKDKYGDEDEIQECFVCSDVRKVWYKPFTQCDADCGRYICDSCIEDKNEFCDYCHKCGGCADLIDCGNCGVYRCYVDGDKCGICKCPACGEGTCDECDNHGCSCCHEELSPGWIVSI
mmetsp:Transcript_16681/g.19306  ORF Transcript_16681/g.19306 Transcript_16681/m.19306 type:complete len:259 (+) Transcript_16681:30-806(+)